MFRRFALALACVAALFTVLSTQAMAGGHWKGMPDDGALAYLRHMVADHTGIAALHPPAPLPAHGEHVAWEIERAGIIATAHAYMADPRVAQLTADVATHAAAYLAYGDMASQHRLDEATALLAQQLAFAGRGDPAVAAMMDSLRETMRLHADTTLCGYEGQLLAGGNGTPDEVRADADNGAALTRLVNALAALAAGSLMLAAMVLSHRRRRQAAV